MITEKVRTLEIFNLLAHGPIIISHGKFRDLPIKIVRYEDLLDRTYHVAKDIIEFINKTTNTKREVDSKKLKNSVHSTSFDKLKKLESLKDFLKQYTQEKNKMITFFNLGPKNNWKNILNKKFSENLTNIFKDDLIQLGYM